MEVVRKCEFCMDAPITDRCLRCLRYLCAKCYDGLKCPKGCSPTPQVEIYRRRLRGRA